MFFQALLQLGPLVPAHDVADTLRRATTTGMVFEAIYIKAVVKAKLFAGMDVPQGMDENPAARGEGLAVGNAGMVDQARRVPRHVAIQIVVLRQVEDVNGGIARAQRLRVLLLRPAIADILVDKFADVFDDLRLLGNEGGGIDAAPVDVRTANFAARALSAVPHGEQFFV